MSIVKINAISVPEGAGPELEKRFAARKQAIDSQPGFEGFQLLRPVAGEDRYFVITRWADEESYNAWRDAEMASGTHGGGAHGGQGAHGAHGGDRKPVASGATLLEFEVVLDSLEP